MSEKLTTASLSSFGDPLPLGTFPARLKNIEPKDSEKNGEPNHWVSLTVDFISGEAEGLTATIAIFPSVTKSPKNGKLYAKGINEAQAYAAKWGAPLGEFGLEEFLVTPERKNGTTAKGARMLQKLLAESFIRAGKPTLLVKVIQEAVQKKNEQTGKYENAHNDDGSPQLRTRAVIIGHRSAAESGGTLTAVPDTADGGNQADNLPDTEDSASSIEFV